MYYLHKSDKSFLFFMEYKGPHHQQNIRKVNTWRANKNLYSIYYHKVIFYILEMIKTIIHSLLTTYRIGNMNNNIHVPCPQKALQKSNLSLQYGIDKTVSGSDKIPWIPIDHVTNTITKI